ncbi:YL1 nuclear protein-domain-containing protein [Lentinula aciculospora]|uniref:YL1 nuclear protein-domain-containing protein n=1 Tax=Lentinula aciculospora TaxID=153920 RepID=A0A9W9AL34_9AGAR|nr:YL1 nuclear protein-domain-containing protein [Lentinula aciculospora]
MSEETLVNRRSKRSTAGNRMQAALAEIAVEDTYKEDAEEDMDYVVETYEEDAFESDFESTDEEEAAAAADQDTVENEEKQARKTARSRLQRATAAAHARQKITFNPTVTDAGAPTSTSTPKTKPKKKRRVSLGFAIDIQTGEFVADNDEDDEGHNAEAEGEEDDSTAPRTRKRSSKRQTTIQNTTDTVKRYLKSEQQKVLQPSRKRSKHNNKRPTQAELLARALDTEEGNIVDHRDYLMLEEEKRRLRNKRDQVTVSGPLLRWVSKVEEVKIEVIEEKKEEHPLNATTGYMYSPYLHTVSSSSAYGGYGYTPQSTLPASTTSVANSSTLIALPDSASRTLPPTASTSTTPLSTSAPPNWAALTTSNSSSYPYLPVYEPSWTSTPNSTLPSSGTLNPLPSSRSMPTPAVAATATLTSTFTNPSSPLSIPTTSTSKQNAQYSQGSQFLVPLNFQTPSITTTSTTIQVPGSSSTPLDHTHPEPKKYRTEKVLKSYLVHELSQDDEDAPKPTWEETMKAMFGDHVKWGELKVYMAKNRPMARYIPTCPITGLPAKYFDPRTGVPFANVRAYMMLKRLSKELLAQNQNQNSGLGADTIVVDNIDVDDDVSDGDGVGVGIWDEELGCYVGELKGDFSDDSEAKTTSRGPGDHVVIDLTL